MTERMASPRRRTRAKTVSGFQPRSRGLFAGWRRRAAVPSGTPQEGVVTPIVPEKSVARRALLALVAIMSFLACLSIAAVSIVAERAQGWQRQIADEVTIQIKPSEGVDMEAALARAVDVAMQVPGVVSARPLGADAAAALLEPWLGSDFETADLPIPRIVAVRVGNEVDLAMLSSRLREAVPGALLDDHGQWLQRLSTMARFVILGGLTVLGLVFAATALCVVFATRGAMAGNRIVIEVLHFVGAEDSYIARQFQRHFLFLGLRGAGIGALAALALFGLISLFGRFAGPTPEEAQLSSIFGGLNIGPMAYAGCILTVVILGIIIAVTARLTVRRTLMEID